MWKRCARHAGGRLPRSARMLRSRAVWKASGIALDVTRIGVHAGPAIVGNFGGGRFFDYTAYGDTINIAARLEAVNKQLGTRLCASEAIMKSASHVRGRPIGDLA